MSTDKLPQYMKDLAAGLTGPEHSYIDECGHTVALTARQVRVGCYSHVWQAKRDLALAWYKKRGLTGMDYTVAEKEYQNAEQHLHEMQLAQARAEGGKEWVRCICCTAKITDMVLLRAQLRIGGNRCPACYAHFKQRTLYDNPVRKKRSQMETKMALVKKSNARHCSHCHHFRPRSSFDYEVPSGPLAGMKIKGFRDAYAKCYVCRTVDNSFEQREKSAKRIVEKQGFTYVKGIVRRAE